jgi:LmbE family N-acetylglucosaminyl deacetylase
MDLTMHGTRQSLKRERIMAVFAHPDDEGQIAGLMAKYASEGIEVSLVSATRGELGSTNNPSLLEGKTMAQLREKELRCVCKVLGVKDLRFLSYHEGSFHTANSAHVIGKISEIMDGLSPQIVITFGPEGVYGHRDHVAISRWTTSAFHVVRRKSLSHGLPFPSKLYYTAYPRSLFDRLRTQGIEFGIDVEGAVHRIEGVPDEKITTVIDVSGFQSQKSEAFCCHRSQLRPGDFRWMIMEGRLMELLATERLVRVFPPVTGSTEIERGLFE